MDLEPEENITDPSDCVTELHTKVRKGGGRKCDSKRHIIATLQEVLMQLDSNHPDCSSTVGEQRQLCHVCHTQCHALVLVEHKGRLAWFMMHWVDGPIVVVLSIAILLVDMAIRKV
eukprot:1394959-Amorphochlora_amoeboformis.AAC.1